jgi:hypothetical protein
MAISHAFRSLAVVGSVLAGCEGGVNALSLTFMHYNHRVRMNMSWIAIVLASCISALGAGCNIGDHSEPPTPCPLTDSGEPCTCPGASVCPVSQPASQQVQFKCSDDGTWEKTDLSCVLGLNCRASSDCMPGQACCGDPYTGSWGTQITSSSCQPAACSSDTVQLCKSSDECVQPGFVCGASDLAYDGGSVLNCAAGAGIDAGRQENSD